jgi:hypothetical protein
MLNKTDKGRQELSQKHRTLGQRERAILLMANGRQSESQLAQLFADEGRHLVRALLERGYLERSHTEDTPQTTGRSDGALTPSPTPAASHGEQFVGARSLATARMFLFDLSERLFAPRDRRLAEHYRQALREAKDGPSMLIVGRDMIASVEALAGSERADSISERLAKLLPEAVLHQSHQGSAA